MKHLKMKIPVYSIALCFITLFCQCEKKESEDSFIFPEIENIDQAVYNEIQKTCNSYWDLSNMIDTTFQIVQDRDEYYVTCDGFVDEVLYLFYLRVDGALRKKS